MSEPTGVFGLMAEFDDPDALVEATEAAYANGYRKMDAYSPYPVEAAHHALGPDKITLPMITLICAAAGGIGIYILEYWTSVIAYPINIGGRPLHSWPSFIPVAFETTILFAAVSCVLALVISCGLPMFYHPVFNVPEFVRASRDGFFLCIESTDPKFDRAETRRFLEAQHPKKVSDVAH